MAPDDRPGMAAVPVSRGSRERVAASRRDHPHRAIAHNEEEAPVLQILPRMRSSALRWLAGIGELLEQLALRSAEQVHTSPLLI